MICNSPTLVLFDSRATHYFISLSHAKSLKHKIEPLEIGMLISKTSSEVFMVEFMCRDCERKVENIGMKINLIFLELKECL